MHPRVLNASRQRISPESRPKVIEKGKATEAGLMVHLCKTGVEPDRAKGSRLRDPWECMLDEFSDVFPVDQPGFPPERSVAMEIEQEEGAKSVAKPAFRLSPADVDELKKQLGLLLEKELVGPSVSPWGAPVLFAPKNYGGLRMCLDYRALDKFTVKNRGPIPRIDEILYRLRGAQHFASLALRSGYYQVRIRDKDLLKT
jgi:hypothetical protein